MQAEMSQVNLCGEPTMKKSEYSIRKKIKNA